MNVTIIPIEDNSRYEINGKIIMEASNSLWIVPNVLDSLSELEKKAFEVYKKLVIDNPGFKKHPRSTYKTHAVFKD